MRPVYDLSNTKASDLSTAIKNIDKYHIKPSKFTKNSFTSRMIHYHNDHFNKNTKVNHRHQQNKSYRKSPDYQQPHKLLQQQHFPLPNIKKLEINRSSSPQKKQFLSPKILPINVSSLKKQRAFSASTQRKPYIPLPNTSNRSLRKLKLNMLEITFGSHLSFI